MYYLKLLDEFKLKTYYWVTLNDKYIFFVIIFIKNKIIL